MQHARGGVKAVRALRAHLLCHSLVEHLGRRRAARPAGRARMAGEPWQPGRGWGFARACRKRRAGKGCMALSGRAGTRLPAEKPTIPALGG